MSGGPVGGRPCSPEEGTYGTKQPLVRRFERREEKHRLCSTSSARHRYFIILETLQLIPFCQSLMIRMLIDKLMTSMGVPGGCQDIAFRELTAESVEQTLQYVYRCSQLDKNNTKTCIHGWKGAVITS